MPKYYPNTTTTYYPFGMLMPGRTYSSEAYSWGFNGKEKDDEISGSGNNLDFGARIYDSRLGRWMSVDPLFFESPNITSYAAMNNNPIFFIDSDGRKVVIPNPAQHAAILKMINDKTGNLFIITAEGELQRKSGPVDASSLYYVNRLTKAINDPNNTISLEIADKYTDKKGNVENVDSKAGGGVTLKEVIATTTKTEGKNGSKTTKTTYSKNARVIISGRSNSNLKDTKGKKLRDEAADILAHELVGHAIPYIIVGDTGNAVDNENKVRDQKKEPLRKKEVDHYE